MIIKLDPQLTSKIVVGDKLFSLIILISLQLSKMIDQHAKSEFFGDIHQNYKLFDANR